MTYETIILEKEEGVATLTLNRPDRLNALNPQMLKELTDAFPRVARDNEVRVLVISGAGRAFCSGADVQDEFWQMIEKKKRGELSGVLLPEQDASSCLALRNMAKPVIAAINGPAVGFGCTLSLACDIRIASDKARLGLVFTRVGMIPEFGSTYTLTRIVGIAKACELVFSARIIDAQEAKESGLVNRVVPHAELQAATMELARSIAQNAPIATALAKQGLYQGLDSDLPTQLQYETFALGLCRLTEDHEEGARAFLEKRQPVFKGR